MSVPLDAMDVNWEIDDSFHSELSELCEEGLAAAEASDTTVSIGGVRISIVRRFLREYVCSKFRWIVALRHLPCFLSLGLDIVSQEVSSRSSSASFRRSPALFRRSSVSFRSSSASSRSSSASSRSSSASSRISLDFRHILVVVVLFLFLGAYGLIKSREVALKGVHRRVYKHGRTPKMVYVARLTPPKWNGQAVPKLELGQFATEQEAHTKFRIAAFYYNRDAGLLDGGFQVPPMSEEARSLTGLEFRAWVIRQAKRVYEDFKINEAAFLLQEYLEAEVTPEQDEVNVDFSVANLLNSAEHQQPALVSQVENLEMDMVMPDDQGVELCAPHSFGGMHEGVGFSNGHSLGFEEGSALPAAQLPPNTESGVSVNSSDHWNLLPTPTSKANLLNSPEHHLPLLGSQAENSGMAIDMQPMPDGQGLQCTPQSFGGMHEAFVTSNGHNLAFQEEFAVPISQLTPDTQSGMCMNNSNQIVQNQQEQIACLRQQLQERDAQILLLQNEKRLDRQQLQESRIHISQLESQHFVEQQLQVISHGVSGFELEQSMFQQNHPCRPQGSAFW